jgi:hypothetical protein
MDRTWVALFIFAAVTVGMLGQAWASWLDHKRRDKALDVIKAAMEAGREPPPQLYEQLESEPYASMGMSKRPWGEAIVFGAVAIGFWVAYAMADDGDARQKAMFVAALMSAFSVGCVALAIFRPGQNKRDDGQ